MSRKRTPTLIHRGYLYGQMHLRPRSFNETFGPENISTRRMRLAEAWRAGYLAAKRDHAKTR